MIINARTAFMTASAAKIFAVSPPCDCKGEAGARRGASKYRFVGTHTVCPPLYFGSGLNAGQFGPARAARWRLAKRLLRCRAMAQSEIPTETKVADAGA